MALLVSEAVHDRVTDLFRFNPVSVDQRKRYDAGRRPFMS